MSGKKDKGYRELNILATRFGLRIKDYCEVGSAKLDPNILYIADVTSDIHEEHLIQKGHFYLNDDLSILSDVDERITPKIPMLLNTIENTYNSVGFYGTSEYAEEVFSYLSLNQDIDVYRIFESDFIYKDGAYLVKNSNRVNILIVFDFLLPARVVDEEGKEVLTSFLNNMYRSNLKSTANNWDINNNIFPKLLDNGIHVLVFSVFDFAKIDHNRIVGINLRLWAKLRELSEELFLKLRHRKFHTTYLLEEEKEVINSSIKGISEVFHNGEYINCENGYRKTPGNSYEVERSIWLFGPCFVRGMMYDDHHTMSAKLQNLVGNRYNVMNRGSVNACLNYVMRFETFHPQDVVVFFSPEPKPENVDSRITYIEMTEVLNRVPHLERHITDSLYHCDEVVLDTIVKSIFQNLPERNNDNVYQGKKDVSFGSYFRRVPDIRMLPENDYSKWLVEMSHYAKEGNNGAIVMNCNPFTYGHRYLIETASKNVDTLYVLVVQEDRSFFPFKNRFEMVKRGTADLQNVVVLPSSSFIISSSSLPGYFMKDKMDSSFRLDATQDIEAFAQVAKQLSVFIRFVGEEPLDQFTNQYNENMKRLLPRYGVELKVIERLKASDEVISASKVRDLLQKGEYELIRQLVPQSTFDCLVSMDLTKIFAKKGTIEYV